MLSPVRPSVCLSVCLSVVTLVHHTQAVVIFGNISTAFDVGHPLKSTKTFMEIVPGEALHGEWELNTTGVAKYSGFGLIEGYIWETVQDRK